MTRSRFDGAAARLAGIAGALLGWRAEEFWRATPAELAAVLAALTGEERAPTVDRADLKRLMERYPDG
jgi:uncharacterized phage protein (TIGR02216 family)